MSEDKIVFRFKLAPPIDDFPDLENPVTEITEAQVAKAQELYEKIVLRDAMALDLVSVRYDKEK